MIIDILEELLANINTLMEENMTLTIENDMLKGIAEKPKPIIKTEIRMKRDRIKNGWSRPYLGRKWKVTGSCIQALEECKNKPSYDLLLKIMDTFGYTDPREPFEMVGIEEIETPCPKQ